MCGINGANGNSESVVLSMNAATIHRGPDQTGVSVNDDFTFGNNRLAIIDIGESGRQPMTSADGCFTIVYNGEIYNYRELRDELKKSGSIFKTNSDTEVILEGFAQLGSVIIPKLRGMWAFAIRENKSGILFLSRDPFGIKPLYLYDDGKIIAFSSEIRGLLANKRVNRNIDTEAVKDLLLLGYIVAPRTILSHARALLPGEEISIDLRSGEKTSFIRKLETDTIPYPPTDDELEELLKDSVKKHLIADVPVGLFFSGGTDSTVLAVLLKELGVRLNAYHLSVPGRDDNIYAKAIAKELDLNLIEVSLSEESPEKFIDSALETLDQPMADTSIIPTMLISKRARQDVKVVLSGEGGDELFGGYLRHKNLPALSGNVLSQYTPLPTSLLLKRNPFLVKILPQINGVLRFMERMRGNAGGLFLAETSISPNLGSINSIENKIKERIGNRERPDGALVFDRLIYLPDDLLLKIDMATMSQSLEGRVPFLDREIFRKVGGAPLSWKRKGGISKAPLKRMLRKNLPRELIERPKTGFSISLYEYFFKYKKEALDEAVLWYQRTHQGLLPTIDAILKYYRSRQEILIRNMGYTLFSIYVLWLFTNRLEKHS